eukprot:1134971-Pleurochrysis_carterae.AAC.1
MGRVTAANGAQLAPSHTLACGRGIHVGGRPPHHMWRSRQGHDNTQLLRVQGRLASRRPQNPPSAHAHSGAGCYRG